MKRSKVLQLFAQPPKCYSSRGKKDQRLCSDIILNSFSPFFLFDYFIEVVL